MSTWQSKATSRLRVSVALYASVGLHVNRKPPPSGAKATRCSVAREAGILGDGFRPDRLYVEPCVRGEGRREEGLCCNLG